MHDLEEAEVKEILKASRLGVLALCESYRAYAIPLFYGYDGEAVYFHCHPGMKDEYFRSTEEACMVVLHMDNEDLWESVHVFGQVEKLSLTNDIEAAKSALFNVPFPPLEGTAPHGTPLRSEQNVYYARLKPTRYAGKESHHEMKHS